MVLIMQRHLCPVGVPLHFVAILTQFFFQDIIADAMKQFNGLWVQHAPASLAM